MIAPSRDLKGKIGGSATWATRVAPGGPAGPVSQAAGGAAPQVDPANQAAGGAAPQVKPASQTTAAPAPQVDPVSQVAGGAAPQVVVVGGGLAGLAAALVAADAGMRVTLLEKRHRLGGATWSFQRNGVNYDNGQHVFMRCFTSYRAFLTRIGSAHKVHLQTKLKVPVLSPNGKLGFIRRSSLPAPMHLLGALLRYPHLSFKERLSAMRTALALRKLGKSLPKDLAPKPCQPQAPAASEAKISAGKSWGKSAKNSSSNPSALDNQTFGSWLRQRGESDQAIQKLWNMIILPTANLPADEVSLLLAARIFVTGLLTSAAAADIGWSKVPLSELHADAAAQALRQAGAQVITQAGATKITADPLGIELQDQFWPADAVIAAVPHTAVDSLLPAGAVARQAELAQLGESPIINVHLVYDQPVCEFDFLGGVDSDTQFVFDRTDSAGLTDGRQCLAVSLSAADAYLALKPQELIDQMAVELERLLPGARGVRRSQEMVTKEVSATFRGSPGANLLRPSQVTQIPGVFLAGAWTDTGWPATMEGAVRSGIVASNYALGYLQNLAEATANHTGQADVSANNLGQSEAAAGDRGQAQVAASHTGQADVAANNLGQADVAAGDRGQAAKTLSGMAS